MILSFAIKIKVLHEEMLLLSNEEMVTKPSRVWYRMELSSPKSKHIQNYTFSQVFGIIIF